MGVMETKYGKLLTTDCIIVSKVSGRPMNSMRHLQSFGDGKFSIETVFIWEPKTLSDKPHRHDFPQYLCFFSATHGDAHDFDADVELSLGEEEEKHVITSPTVVFVPAGLDHGPLRFVRVQKPVLFIDVALTGGYTRVGENYQIGT
jgi:hypothetical protein